MILLIVSGGPFGAFHRTREALGEATEKIPLAILAEQANRGQIYAALRIGAKAFVNLDAEPEELINAVRAASKNKVYLAPQIAEMLVSDVSSASASGPAGRGRLPRVGLSARELEVVRLLCEGHSSKGIGRHLHISAKTVENHRYNIYRKCDVDSLAALMRHAIQRGLVTI